LKNAVLFDHTHTIHDTVNTKYNIIDSKERTQRSEKTSGWEKIESKVQKKQRREG
jgi:hypothetical protein